MKTDNQTATAHAVGSGDLFALVESRKCYFWLAYEREHRSPLVDSGMIWRCRCAAPQSYEVTGKTAEEAVRNALTRAAELDANKADMPSGR